MLRNFLFFVAIFYSQAIL